MTLGSLAITCRANESQLTPVILRDPSYLVLRPLTWKADPDHAQRVAVTYTSVGYAFAANQPLLDMHAFDLSGARVDNQKDSMGATTLWVPLTGAGTQTLAVWSAQNVGEHLGIFVQGKLVQAVGIKSKLSLPSIPIAFEDGVEALAVLKRLKNGGSSGG